MSQTCKNCGGTAVEAYCPSCGEKAYKRLNLKDLLSDFFANSFALELPILRTLKELSISPGPMLRSFIGGQRVKYYKPFQYYLVMLTLYYVFYVISGEAAYDYVSGITTPEATDNIEAEHIKELQTVSKKFSTQNMKYLLFLQAPILAWLLRLFFKKEGYNYTETTVMALYLLGHNLLINTLGYSIYPFAGPGVFLLTNICTSGIYYLWVVHSTFRGSTGLKLIKGLSIYLLSFLCFSILIMIFTTIRIILYYQANI